MDNKKFKILSSIENDPPFGNINWVTISFISPDKIEKTKNLGITGFKVYDGYNTSELADKDAKSIKSNNQFHDVYISQMGKLYAWDDATKTDAVEFDDNKLNDLETTRRENMDKLKLVAEQFKNEYKKSANPNNRTSEYREKLKQKLYDRGLITSQEYELMQESNNKRKKIQKNETSIDELNECFKTDYLDENNQNSLKYGCLTIYNSKYIKNLNSVYFKIRGLYQTPEEMDKKIKKLQNLYPNDRLYKFEVGKWTVIPEDESEDSQLSIKKLNFAMKCYLDNLETEKVEFEKRKDSLQTQNDQNAASVKTKKDKKQQKTEPKSVTEVISSSIGDQQDSIAVQNILNYLNDDDLKNKFSTTNTVSQTVDLN